MRKITIILLLLLLVPFTSCQQQEREGASIQQLEGTSSTPEKKVILVIIDSMMGSLVQSGLDKGTIPALEFLMENGQYYNDLVSAYPSMSTVIDSTLVTGSMNKDHRIPGLVWYSRDENRIVDYGSTFVKMYKLGMRQSVIDGIYELNNTHLSQNVRTIHEELQQRNYTTGNINLLTYRGETTHQLTLPAVLDEWLDINGAIQTKGPDILALGTLVKPKVIHDKDVPDGLLERFGFNDVYSAEVAKSLIQQGEQPDFLTVYLPSFDKEAHKNSPYYRKGFERAENMLMEILNSFDSWDKALEENIFIVLGDHGQDKLVGDKEEMAIDLDSIYYDYPIAKLSEDIVPGSLVFANNHRMSYIYSPGNEQLLGQLAEEAMVDARIGFAAWLEDGWVNVISPDEQEMLRFRPGSIYTDRYDQQWDVEGNENVLTLLLEQNDKQIQYVDYPDILNQVYSALTSNEEPALILDAKPGHSFKSEGAPMHNGGGEHGSAHKNDTLTSIVIAGTDKKPKHLRIVDLKEYVLELFEK